MDAGVQMVALGFTAVIAIVLAALAFVNFRNFKKRNDRLNRAHEMTGNANGYITDLETVYRRNRSFRWKNEIPVITYRVDGRDYKVKMDFAEKRAGQYSLGGSYHVCYIPSDPSCSIVEEFRKPLQSSRTRALVGTVALCLFVFNCICGTLMQLGTLFM